MSHQGCDELRDWLTAEQFKIAADPFGSSHNLCNWYAYRRSTLPARECECNQNKTMQIVVKPYWFKAADHESKSAEVDVTGEAGGVWFKLQAYSVPQVELPDRLGDIEQSLVAAWNALTPAQTEGAA